MYKITSSQFFPFYSFYSLHTFLFFKSSNQIFIWNQIFIFFFIYVTTFMLLFPLGEFFPFSSLCSFHNFLFFQMFKWHLYLKSYLYFLFSIIFQPFATIKLVVGCLFLLLSAIFPLLAQHWAMWDRAFGFFICKPQYVYGFSKYLCSCQKSTFAFFCAIHMFNNRFSQFLLNLWNQNQCMCMVLFLMYDLPI